MSLLARISRKCSAASPMSWVKSAANAGRLDEFGGADVVTLGGDHEVEQAGQRGIDDLEGAPGALVVAGHGAADRFQRRADGGERRLEGMCLVLRRLADLLRHAAQVMDQLVEVAGHARELGHDIAVAEGVVADAALADLGGDLAEAAQAQSDADRHQKGDHRQHEVDHRGDADLARLPVGAADRGVEELGGGVGGSQDPASRGGPDGNDRGQQLEGAVGLLVADLVGGIPHAGVGKPLQDAAMAELVQFGRYLVGADLRRRRHEIEALGHARRFGLGLEHQLQDRAVAAVFGEVGVQRHLAFVGVDILERGRQCIGDQGAAVLDGPRHEVPHLPVGALELAVQHDGQSGEDADQGDELQGQRGGKAVERPPPADRWRARSFPSGSRRTGSYRSRQRWGRRLGTCF